MESTVRSNCSSLPPALNAWAHANPEFDSRCDDKKPTTLPTTTPTTTPTTRDVGAHRHGAPNSFVSQSDMDFYFYFSTFKN